jgi:holliday junction DNA helicase RuvA
MIASVRGEVTAVDLDHAVVEVGGVGLAVHATPATLATLRRGEQAALATALVVREDSLTLYGFADTAAKELFTLLQTVSGVGPRLALAMLAVLDPDKLRGALAEGNTALLTQVPGIGRKGAERLIIELRDKVGAVASAATTAGLATGEYATGQAHDAAHGQVRGQVTEALVGLGFAVKQAEQAVQAVLEEHSGAADTAAVLRGALSRLGRHR